MCTAITYQSTNSYFGRNLDFEHSFGETVTITPRNYPFQLRRGNLFRTKYAMIGMATIDQQYPLYYDATNECGLSVAGLYFPDNAVYHSEISGLYNITPFEFIPWILGQCRNLQDAEERLRRINLIDIPYNDQYPQSPLHWIIADKEASITVESVKSGLNIYKNPIGVLTNNPPFDYHLHNLSNYINLTREEATNRFAPDYPIKPYSRGMGAVGLPGDLSSSSRFIKAAFTKLNSISDGSEVSDISQFFHILSSVAQQNGCVKVGDQFERTIYSSCCNVSKGIYYYTTYENSQITGISMNEWDLNSTALTTFPLRKRQNIYMEN